MSSEGSEVAIWERCGRGGVVRWHSGTGARAVKWQGERLSVLFKCGRRRVRPRFHLFISDPNQQNEEV